MFDRSTIYRLREALTGELPGFDAQKKMAPKFRLDLRQMEGVSSNARPSSVLIPLYFKEDVLHTVLTQRHEYNGVHSNQISFPGGKKDNSDPDLQFTALREACEEVNICDRNIEILGELTPLYIPPSNFLVSPYIGYLKSNPQLIPQESEVAEILEVPVELFLKEQSVKTKTIHLADGNFSESPYFDVEGKVVWGATAMILGEFVAILKKIL